MAKSSRRKGATALIFDRWNYLLLIASALLIFVGFLAMHLDGQFLGVISLDVAPVVIMGGYAGIIYAILWRPGEDSDEEESA